MRMTLLLALAVFLSFSLATAQPAKIVFGPLDGDNAGAIVADTGETIEVQVWIRTEPGINIVGLHIPLASKDEMIQSDSRDDGDLLFPFPLWDDVSFLNPNPDVHLEEYTNQSILGIKDIVGDPDSLNGIETNGEWSEIATFTMTTATDGDGIPHDDAFALGSQGDNGSLVLVDYPSEEMDNSTIVLDFATLELPQTVGVEDDIVRPDVYSLKQNYPNPFNASTTISYTLPEGNFVSIEIYDIMGRKIRSLVSEYQNAGFHSAIWNASDVSSGVYLYRLTAGNYVETRRCNLLK